MPPRPAHAHAPAACRPRADDWIANPNKPKVCTQRTEIGVVPARPERMISFIIRKRCWRTRNIGCQITDPH